MATIDDIRKPIESEMAAFEPKFKAAMASPVAMLNRISHYIVRRKGKQLRPILVFLTAKIHGEVSESTYRGASLIELMHTATLVHDDVVDDSNIRRGFFSLNALWKNKIAVLVGDYMLSKVLLLAVEHKEHELLRLVSTSVREMSEGELLQIEKARRLDIDEAVYFEIVRKKTASLIASCCAVGTASVQQDPEITERMHRFGELLGIAFQIKDDLFDYQFSNLTGKPTGIDIKEQKMTLPLIHALKVVEPAERKEMIRTVKRHNRDSKRVRALIDRVIEVGGIRYAEEKMHQYRNQAVELLESYPESEEKTSLLQLVEYVIDRVK